MSYDFDRFLRYDELIAWLHELAAAHPDLVAVETYGTQPRGPRPVARHGHRLVDRRPRHQAGALGRRQHPRRRADRPRSPPARCCSTSSTATRPATRSSRRRCATRTFYVVPTGQPRRRRVGARRPAPVPPVEHPALAVAPTPTAGPALHVEDVDGDGRILQMRIADPDGAWMPHPDDARLLVPVPLAGARRSTPRATGCSTRARSSDYDGFTIPTPRPPEGLDLNRNFPAGWGTGVPGSGDHPLSEPEIDALVRAIVARPNVCGYNAFHTSGGVLLRPSSTRPDSTLPPVDVWAWKQLGEVGTALTGYPVHSVYEDFTWDKSETMSGAADDWAYEHLGVSTAGRRSSGTSSHAATGDAGSRRDFVVHSARPTTQALAVLRWATSTRPASYVDWYPFEHPQLGPVELGGWHVPRRRGRTRPLDLLTRRGRAARRVRRRPGPGLAVPGDPPHRPPSTSAAARGGSRSASPTPAGCRRRCRRGRPQATSCRPIVAEVGGEGVDVRRRRRPASSSASSAGRGTMRFAVRPRRHARPAPRHLGRAGRTRRRGHGDRPPRPGRPRRDEPGPRGQRPGSESGFGRPCDRYPDRNDC